MRGMYPFLAFFYTFLSFCDDILTSCRFGWVNASYVYGLEILNAHMRRALGAITPWETYTKAIAAQREF